MEYKKQHYIPQSYLAAWTDPQTPDGQHPYVWIIDKDNLSIRNKSPKNILYGTDFYTVETDDGERDVTLEKILSSIEGGFIRVRDTKIIPGKPLDQVDLFDLKSFVAIMRSRTPSSGDRWKSIWGSILAKMEEYETFLVDEEFDLDMSGMLTGRNIKNGNIMTADDVREIVDNPITTHIGHSVKTQLEEMRSFDVAVLHTTFDQGFITSDNPVVWADPYEYRKPSHMRRVGLRNPTIEITMPITPNHFLFLNKYGVNEYINLDDVSCFSRIDTIMNANSRTFNFAKKYIITNMKRIKWDWKY